MQSQMIDALWGVDGLFDQVTKELDRALDLHGPDKLPSNEDMPLEKAYTILAEEVGEVARGILDGNDENTREELIQTAAMALAIASRFPK